MKTQAQVEQKEMAVGAMVYLILGISGWYTFYLSNSEAMLLDGNYNMVNALASFIGLYVIRIRNSKTETFPWGQYIFENLYGLIKGVLILGILTAALWENSVKIYDFYIYGKLHHVNSAPIIYLVILSIVLCFGMAYFNRKSNKGIGGTSSMLATDTKAAMIDGYLSLFSGGGLLLMIYLGKTYPSISFLQYIGDSIVVLVFEIIMLREPLHIIKLNFIELVGGQIQSDRDYIRDKIRAIPANEFEVKQIYITKTGSMILVLVYISAIGPTMNVVAVKGFKSQIDEILSVDYQCFMVEFINE